MQVLITGINGFLGNNIRNILGHYSIISISRTNSTVNCDLSKSIPTVPACNMVIHAAGKAHVLPSTIEEKQAFFDVNVSGTLNLLKGLEKSPILPKSFIFISSVAVYGQDSGNMINEDAALAATDPYGISKIEAENLILAWCKKNNVTCTILRLPLIAGINPPGNLKAMINGIKKGYYFNIDNGAARKSIVLAEDVAKIIPVVADVGGVYNLTDGYHPSFFELSEIIAQQLNKPKPINIPMWVATLMAKAGNLIGNKAPINSSKLKKITSDLTFDDSRAKTLLNWQPTPVLKGFKIK